MRKCELCDRTAKMYCESDQASLCWDCDEKVHRANFLVAKHCRTLLCHICQSLTPWKGSGDKLGPTVSVCESCFAAAHCNRRENGAGLNQSERSDMAAAADGEENVDNSDYETETEDDDEEEEEDYDDEEEVDDEDDDENQVVPWSGESNSPPPPPPPVSCSSSSSIGTEEEVSLKRRRDFTDFHSDDEIGCSSSHIGSRETATANEEANTSSMMLSFRRNSKHQRLEADDDHNQADSSRSTEIINSLRRLQKQMINNRAGDESASAAVLAICRLSRDEN